MPPAALSCDQTWRRVLALAIWILPSLAGVSWSRVRHTVGAEATGPSTCDWCRNTLMSEMASPPSASITATSVKTCPRSWTGTNERRTIAFESCFTHPVRSATNPQRDAAGMGDHADAITGNGQAC